MFRPIKDVQNAAEFVFIEDLVPQNHLIRKVDKYVDFSFIGEKVRSYYSEDTGRPTDPIMLFKMMIIGYFYGIRSESQLEREIQTKVAYRWFLGLKLNDPVPHHSTISWNRRTRFKDTNIFQELFDEVVYLAINHNMVGGRALFSDSTHLKANANKNKFTREEVEEETREYIEELNKALKTTS